MKQSNGLKQSAAAVGLWVGAQSALALPPTTPLPDAAHTIYLAGGAAQDPALDKLIADNLAASGTLDIYYDNGNPNGSKYRAYFFTTNTSKVPGLSSASVNVLIYKRSNGGAGYGVIPLIQDPPPTVKQLDFTPANSWTFDATNNRYVVSGTQTGQYADAGITGVNPSILTGGNYPQPSGTGVGDVFSTTETVPSEVSARLAVTPAGGLTYGLAVTKDFYKVLQAAQIYSGTLPSTTPLGSYNQAARIPTLTRQFAASLIAGKIKSWDSVVVFNSAGVGKTLPEIASANGITLPTQVGSGTSAVSPVSMGNRNKGAAVGAAFSAKLLNYPTLASAFPPASQPTLLNPLALPYVTQAPGASQQEQVLLDWQNGTNVSGLNPPAVSGGTPPKRWGVAEQSTDWNPSYAKDYRYVRIDSYAPTLANIHIGGYPLWAEQTLQWRKTYTGATATFTGLIPTGDKLLILKKLAAVLGSPSAAAQVNAQLGSVIGATGLFGVSTDSSVKTLSAAFDPNNPIIPYTHVNGALNDWLLPVVNGGKLGTVKLP